MRRYTAAAKETLKNHPEMRAKLIELTTGSGIVSDF
jgi:hypothetical protein